jgi:hypothetical protein
MRFHLGTNIQRYGGYCFYGPPFRGGWAVASHWVCDVGPCWSEWLQADFSVSTLILPCQLPFLQCFILFYYCP